ncbi:MAG: metal-sensitive transcriptional regulator [Patescibacteria group bacterium]|jgi:DNA-binding FrmR family transcriptional regulator
MDNHTKKVLHRMKIAKGHLEKVIDMVEKGEYCLNIIQQSQAVQSALSKVDEVILENHLRTCVKKSMISGKDLDKKVNEVIEVFKRK